MKLHISDHGVYVVCPETEARTLHHQVPGDGGDKENEVTVSVVANGSSIVGLEDI